MKSIQELRAEEARIRSILKGGAEAKLRAIPGVIHVSVGLKQINGTATEEFCIRVYVAKKKDRASIPPAERIPESIAGVRTDVNEVELMKPLEDTARYRPITGGIQIEVIDPDNDIVGDGTLGCLATDNTDGKTVLVTNAHVIGATAGVSVFQPVEDSANLVGTVKRALLTGTIDAAIVDIAAGISTTGDEINNLSLNQSNHIAGVTDPVAKMRVYKVGCTTGRTFGRVVDADAVANIDYHPPLGVRFMHHGISIQSLKVSGCCCCTCEVADIDGTFVDEGDSGSAVISDQGMAVGLVIGGGFKRNAFACRMTEVESLMNVTINRTATAPARLEGPHDFARMPGAGPAEPIVATGAPALAEDDTVWSILQRRLEGTPFGREIAEQVRRHVPEVVELVNHHRAVMVAWQRAQGPSFLAQWMNGVRNPSLTLPREISGVTMNSALLKMASVLKEYGSPSLQQAIDSNGLELMALLDRSATVDALIENIENPVPA